MTDKVHITKLARIIADRRTDPPQMTGSTTAGGADIRTRQDRLPMPIGTEGQVLTVVDDGGDLVPSWEDATGGVGSGQYRQYVLVSDGAGGFDFVDDGFSNPVTTLEDLE